MQKPTNLQKKLWTILIFLLVFNIMALPMYVIINYDIYIPWLQEITAQNTYGVLILLGQDVKLDGLTIQTATYNFKIIRDCTAWKSMWAFIALIVATPFVTSRSRIIALLWGIPSIYLLNLVRTSSTIYVGINNPSFFEVVHTLLWREGLILVIFAMWYIWFIKTRDSKLENYRLFNKIFEKIKM